MQHLKIGAIAIGTIGSLLITACDNKNASEDLQKLKISTALLNQHNHSQEIKNHAQQTNSNTYNLELIIDSESDEKIYLDLCFEKGNKQIKNAKVTAQIKFPNGQEKTIPLKYVAEKKHYHNVLPEKITGEYKITIYANVGNKIVNREASIQI